jgi:protein-S-isoprenylcysteine O-methyltransferase Ste14
MTNTKTMQGLEARVPPPILATLFAVAMWQAARVLTPVPVPVQLRYVLTAVFGLFGVTVAALGILAFRRAKTTINPVNPGDASTVVTSGIYRITRNPMYVGLAAALITLAVWLSVPWLLLGPVAFIFFITRFQIIPEERAMSLKFGPEYDQYRRRVPGGFGAVQIRMKSEIATW